MGVMRAIKTGENRKVYAGGDDPTRVGNFDAVERRVAELEAGAQGEGATA